MHKQIFLISIICSIAKLCSIDYLHETDLEFSELKTTLSSFKSASNAEIYLPGYEKKQKKKTSNQEQKAHKLWGTMSAVEKHTEQERINEGFSSYLNQAPTVNINCNTIGRN